MITIKLTEEEARLVAGNVDGWLDAGACKGGMEDDERAALHKLYDQCMGVVGRKRKSAARPTVAADAAAPTSTDPKAFEKSLWELVEEARKWESAYRDPGTLYAALDSYKTAVEEQVRYIINSTLAAHPVAPAAAAPSTAALQQLLERWWQSADEEAAKRTVDAVGVAAGIRSCANSLRSFLAAQPTVAADAAAPSEEIERLRAVAKEYDACIRHMDAGGDFREFMASVQQGGKQ